MHSVGCRYADAGKYKQQLEELSVKMKACELRTQGGPPYSQPIFRCEGTYSRAVVPQTACFYTPAERNINYHVWKCCLVICFFTWQLHVFLLLLHCRLGQRVVHRQMGYRGVVAGWDTHFCESDGFAAAAKVNAAPRGKKQPFYMVRAPWLTAEAVLEL